MTIITFLCARDQTKKTTYFCKAYEYVIKKYQATICNDSPSLKSNYKKKCIVGAHCSRLLCRSGYRWHACISKQHLVPCGPININTTALRNTNGNELADSAQASCRQIKVEVMMLNTQPASPSRQQLIKSCRCEYEHDTEVHAHAGGGWRLMTPEGMRPCP